MSTPQGCGLHVCAAARACPVRVDSVRFAASAVYTGPLHACRVAGRGVPGALFFESDVQHRARIYRPQVVVRGARVCRPIAERTLKCERPTEWALMPHAIVAIFQAVTTYACARLR
jgi:hypothetical protein